MLTEKGFAPSNVTDGAMETQVDIPMETVRQYKVRMLSESLSAGKPFLVEKGQGCVSTRIPRVSFENVSYEEYRACMYTAHITSWADLEPEIKTCLRLSGPLRRSK